MSKPVSCLSQNLSIPSPIQSNMNASLLSSDARSKRILIDPVDNDWISKLPDELLVMILRDMSTEDAIMTGMLSKRWQNVWKQVPYLTFNMQKPVITNKMGPRAQAPHIDRVAESITKVIKNHNGHLVGCSIEHYSRQCHNGVLDAWIQSLTREKHIRALAISNLQNRCKGRNMLQLSPNTFSHPNLVTLFLYIYDLNSAHAFNNCHNLKILKLEKIFAEVDVLNKVIASCPSLKILVLHGMWYNERACLKIHNNNLKLLHVSSSDVDCIEVSAALLDIFSICNIFYREINLVIEAPRLLFNNGDKDLKRGATLNYNISCHAEEKGIIGHAFLVNINATYLHRVNSLRVVVDVMNLKEMEMLRQVLVVWKGIMEELNISFKDNNGSKEEGESSTGGGREKDWEEAKLFPNADFRVEVIKMFSFSGSNKKQFALASRFITQGTVTKKMMIKTSSILAKEKLDTEAAVAKLMELPKGNENLLIECF